MSHMLEPILRLVDLENTTRKSIEGGRLLPERKKQSNTYFSPWTDRVSLFSLSILGIIAIPSIDSILDNWFGSWSLEVTIFGLIVTIPLLATSIGKLYTRARS